VIAQVFVNPTGMDEEMGTLCMAFANLNLKSPVENTTPGLHDITKKIRESQVRVEKDLDTSDDPKICEIRSIPYGFQG
jgi:hypothetical protein